MEPNIPSYFPMHISELDLEILLRLDVKSIDVVRNTYEYINNLCDKRFWCSKFKHDHVDLGPNVDYKTILHDIYPFSDIDVYYWAKNNNYAKLVNFLINKPVVKKHILNERLKYAVSNENVDNVRKLLNEGADPNYQYGDAISIAIEKGSDMVEVLLEYGVDPNIILRKSLPDGTVDVIQLLIYNGADITQNDNKLLIDAAYLGNYDFMRILLAYGADPHTRNDEVLFNAAGSDADYPPLLELLVDNGVDIHVQDDKALLVAVENGNLDTVKWLIDHGAKISQSTLSTIKSKYYAIKVRDYLKFLII